MIFGIDLGTTNSLIGHGNTMYSNLVSSNVDVRTRKQVKRDVVSEDVVSSYKTDMSIGESGQLPIQCSAIILKELAEIGTRRSGEQVKDVVISVPAYFNTSQREAVYKSAELAGLNLKALINEPTAASLYVCKDNKDLVVVYDLGGGTFDVTIIDSRVGSYSVIATDGIVLGGDDLDMALANRAFNDCKVQMRYRSKLNTKMLKSKMRLAKEEIQRTHSDVYVDMRPYGVDKDFVLTEEIYIEETKEVFGKTIDMTGYLINKYIPECEKPKLVLVGGSSTCPYLRQMICDELELEILPCDINPDLVVARGAALYAEMLENGRAQRDIQDVTKRLCIEDNLGKAITIIERNSILPCSNSIVVTNEKDTDTLTLKLYQGDSIVARNNQYIGTLEYDYGEVMAVNTGDVRVTVEVSFDGVISLSAVEVLYGGNPQSIQLTSR